MKHFIQFNEVLFVVHWNNDLKLTELHEVEVLLLLVPAV